MGCVWNKRSFFPTLNCSFLMRIGLSKLNFYTQLVAEKKPRDSKEALIGIDQVHLVPHLRRHPIYFTFAGCDWQQWQ